MGTLRLFRALCVVALAGFISCSDDNTDEGNFEQLSGEKVRLTIEIIPSGSGVVYPHSGTYDKGQNITLRPDANTGYRFSHWTGDVASDYHSETIKLDSDKTITAVFMVYRNDFLNPQE